MTEECYWEFDFMVERIENGWLLMFSNNVKPTDYRIVYCKDVQELTIKLAELTAEELLETSDGKPEEKPS